MKKIWIMILMFVPLALVAQQDTVIVITPDVPIPDGAGDIVSNFQFWIGAFSPLVGLTITVTAFILKIFNILSGGLKQVISWGVGAVLVVALSLLNLGIAKELAWYGVIAYAVAVALAANRAFDVKLLDSILQALGLNKK